MQNFNDKLTSLLQRSSSNGKKWQQKCRVVVDDYQDSNGNIDDVLRYIYRIDEFMLDNIIKDTCCQQKIELVCGRIIANKTTLAAKTILTQTKLKISIDFQLFDELFDGSQINKQYLVGGNICSSRWQCLTSLINHEIVHALLFLQANFHKKKINDNHGKFFRVVLQQFFNQNDIHHALYSGFNATMPTNMVRDKCVAKKNNKTKIFANGKWRSCKLLEIINDDEVLVAYRFDGMLCEEIMPIGLLSC